MFLVSHDRAFLDNVVTQVIASSGDGNWLENAGGYDDWVAYCNLRQRDESALQRTRRDDAALSQQKRKSNATAEAGSTASPGSMRATSRKRPPKLAFRELRELEALPGNIASLEAEQAELTARVEDPALYVDETGEAQRVAARLSTIDDELTVLLQRWEELESRKT